MTEIKDNKKNELVPVVVETTPAALLQLAVQKDLDITKLEKLMELQEHWQAGNARKEFLTAMSNFQFACPVLKKTKEVTFNQTKFSYAPIGEITGAIKKPLNDNGLSFRWEIKEEGELITLTCIVSHASGHSESTTMSAAKDISGSKNQIQSRGSTITYLQRYTLIAALGISTADEDDDGKEVVVSKKQPVTKPKPEPKNNIPVPEISEGWKNKIAACKTPGDVDQVIAANVETVNRHPHLKKFLEDRKTELAEEIVKGPPHQLDEIPGINAEKGGKPPITNEQYKTSMTLICNGDLQEYYRVLADYSMDGSQATKLKSAYTEAKEKKNKVSS